MPRGATPPRDALAYVSHIAGRCEAINGFQEGAAGPGGDRGITPPQTLQPGGEDYMEVCLYISWQDDRWQALTAMLDAGKEEAVVAKQEHMRAPTPIASIGEGWYIHPQGYVLGGKGGKGPQVRWKLEREGVRLGLLNRQTPHETLPNAHVVITGDVMLAAGGLDALWPRVRAWVEGLGAEIVAEKVSRVDACYDIFDVPVSEFYDAFHEGRVVTRAKKSAEFGEGGWKVWKRGRRVTGFTVGAAPALTIYDKREECHDPAVLAMLIERKWGGQCPEIVTRAEFRLRSEFLRDGRWLPHEQRRSKCRKAKVVQTVGDWIAHRVAVVEYLTRRWVRFVREGFDRRHTERAESTGFWAAICEGFAKLWDRLAHQPPAFEYSKVTDETMIRQAIGCFTRAVAMRRTQVENADDFLGECVDMLARTLATVTDIPERIAAKLGSLAPPRRVAIPI